MRTQKIRENLENSRILIIDDDSFIVKTIQKALAYGGFSKTLSASTGKKALDILCPDNKTAETDNEDIDLVILDIVLPDINGFEISKKIRNAHLDIPIILISGYDLQNIDAKVIEVGADDFLMKPFNIPELLARVKLHLGKKRDQQKKRFPIALTNSDIIDPKMLRKNYRLPYIGDIIDGYLIVDFLGWGKTTVIYKVTIPSKNELYALKILTLNAATNINSEKRFQNEIKVMSRVNHPNIVKFVSNGIHKGCPYIVMEYIDGMDLEELLITRGRLSIKKLLNMAINIASGIYELHKFSIIHRDIKLKNIFYEHKSGEVKISDFGIAKAPDSLHMTQDGYVLGTPLYIAPELISGDEPGIRSDIYSYGATIYQMVTGSPPFTAENSSELYEKIKNESPQPISFYREDAGPEWDELIVWSCLARDPKNRPASMMEIISKLKQDEMFAGIKT